jgi:hypothetical protein
MVETQNQLGDMFTFRFFFDIMLNWAYTKGSMIEGYNTEEVIVCCQEYLKDKRGIGLPDSHHKGRLAEK